MDLEPENIRGDAIAWHLRLRDGGDADWAAFSDWLAADPAHPRAYAAIEEADFDFDAELRRVLADTLVAETHAAPPRVDRRWFAWGGGALVASIAGALLVLPASHDFYEVATRPGEQRVIALDDATSIALNGGTRLRLDRTDPRHAVLESGEAQFTVRHDPDRPFTLEIGEDRIVDVGTRFNVARRASGLDLAVAEGAVLYNPDREAVPVSAGQRLREDRGSGRVMVERIDAGTVGGWHRGQFTYSGTPLAAVAEDLARALGRPVAVAPAIGARPFSGTIVLERGDRADPARLATVLQVRIVAIGTGWRMEPANGATP